MDHKEGIAAPIPHCSKCKQPLRPNINLKEDIGWIDTRAVKEDEEFKKWFEPNRLRSLTILEIGCGPVQPIGRQIADNLLKSDKYRCAVVRINPVKERSS